VQALNRREPALGKLLSAGREFSFGRSSIGLKAYAPGIYPRSEALVQATRDLDRGRATADAVAAQFEADFGELVTVQERAGLDPLSDGMLEWQDLFRPLADRSEGLEARPLTRFLDTNTFYRAILVDGKPRLREPLPAPALPAGRWLATLPSPLAFSRATGGAASADSLAGDVLAPQIEAYADGGAALIVLSDPFLAREEGVKELGAALERLPRRLPFVLQLPFGDAGPLLAELAELPVDAIGVDFYGTSLDAVPTDYPKEIVAGVVDARSSALEDPAQVARFVDELLQRNPADLSVSTNGDLQFVPEAIAREKLARLGGSRTRLREVA
jgi:5-methyltetrahydropteroyltriglutamate--homocysteine methyltransferase